MAGQLRHVYRARNLKALYEKRLLFLATPSILPPSATKLLYATRLNDFWTGMGDGGYLNLVWLSSGSLYQNMMSMLDKFSTALLEIISDTIGTETSGEGRSRRSRLSTYTNGHNA